MKPVVLTPIPTLGDVPEPERNATVNWLLPLCHQQQGQLAAQLALQSEQMGLLKDEIAVLKGEKARPKIKPSSVNSDAPEPSGSDPVKKERRGRGKSQKNPRLTDSR